MSVHRKMEKNHKQTHSISCNSNTVNIVCGSFSGLIGSGFHWVEVGGARGGGRGDESVC